MLTQLETAITNLRQLKPLVLCLTNYVTMDLMANSLLALGASPLMSVCDDELEELIKIAQVVTINIGTLDHDFIARCQKAIDYAAQHNKPIILDPVGAGASKMRTQHAREFLGHANIIRGNASEINALLDDLSLTRGVDTSHSVEQTKDKAHQLAVGYQCTVVISGKEDFITDGKRETSLSFGSPLMPLVTGMGCTLTAIIAAFRAVITDEFEAAKLATSFVGLCGNLAHLKSTAPGSFRTTFIDELYKADFELMNVK
ncbi:MAG: hydroxyethylthiazole kinase [Legionellales bacterium]|nr:hydroxyethylthiazole kinase [Legionellales bacterium]